MSGEIPAGEGSVFHFLDIFALGCGLEACAALFRGDSPWKVMAGVFGAVAFHIVGTKWASIKSRLWPAIGTFLDRLGKNRWIRLGTTVLIVGYFVLSVGLYVQRLRDDLDTYAMPRHVTKKQADALKEYLSQHEPYAVSVKTVPYDQEAMEYASELFNALRETNWDVDPPDHGGPGLIPMFNPPEPKIGDVDPKGKPLYKNMSAYLDAHDEWIKTQIHETLAQQFAWTGIQIQVEQIGQPANPDPKHPSPDTILRDAFHSAGINAASGGGSYSRGKYSITVFVGRRPLETGEQIPLRFKIANWIMGLNR